MRSALLRVGYEQLVRPALFRSYGGDPEKVHEAMIALLGRLGDSPVAGLVGSLVGRPTDPVTVAGVRFPGRVGLAAGVDKDGVAARIWAQLGFGFAELGTVTALPQPGNPTPRVFRLTDSQALINRMGFNNHGAAALAARLETWGVWRGADTLGIPLGISIGKSKVVAPDQAVADYLAALDAVLPYADYVAVNVSSPNTEGLRSWQAKDRISELVKALVKVANQEVDPLPIFVKIAPDLTDQQIDDLLDAVVASGAAGVIATNTTLSRDGIQGADVRHADQAGGLSGAPLTRRARQVVAQAMTAGLPVIASGGIMTVADAQAMFDLGASLVQLYTGFIYSGPGLVAGINSRRCPPTAECQVVSGYGLRHAGGSVQDPTLGESGKA